MPFKAGEIANPSGRPASAFNWQNYTDRVCKILEKYEPDQIISIGNQVAAGKKNLPVSSFDALIIVNLSSALQKDGKERERLLDRLLGKAVIRIGGESADKPIRITNALTLEAMDTETLLELKAVIDKAKRRITLDNPPQLAPPAIESLGDGLEPRESPDSISPDSSEPLPGKE